MKLQLPKNKSLSTATRMRLFTVDQERIKEIAACSMHAEVAVARLAVNAGLPLIAKQLGIKLHNGDSPSA